MTGWFGAVRRRKRALRASRRGRAALDAALRQLHTTYSRHPLHFVLGAAATGWVLGRANMGRRALQAAAGAANGRTWQTWRLVRQLMMTMVRS